MVRSEVLKLWEQALKILEKKLNKNSFDTWLKPLIPLGCHESTIIIEVPNNFSRGWLSDRYAPLLKKCDPGYNINKIRHTISPFQWRGSPYGKQPASKKY